MSNGHWQEITGDDAKQWLNNSEVLFVDVRELDEYEEGHIPNIVHIPLSEFVERVGELDKDQEIVMVCRSGNRSSRACEYLASLGYSKLHNLAGGMLYWDGEVE